MCFRGFSGRGHVSRLIELGEDYDTYSDKKPPNIYEDCSLPSMEGQACSIRKNSHNQQVGPQQNFLQMSHVGEYKAFVLKHFCGSEQIFHLVNLAVGLG